jgi:outer membrane protein TolC
MRWLWCVLSLALGCGPSAAGAGLREGLRARAAELAPRRATGALPGTREGLVGAAIARDPGMAARLERARAALAQAGVEASLPAPEAAVQVWNVPFQRPWALGDADMYMVELRQRLPPAGLRGAREREALALAEAALAELGTRERDLARRVAGAWAEHLAAARHHRVHHAHLAVIARMAEVARGRLATGRGGLDELPRLDAEQARVRRLLSRFDNDRRRAARALAVLLGRDLEIPLALPDEAPGESVGLSLDALVARALARRGAALAARSALAAARAGALAAHAEASRPELMVGLTAWIDPDHHHGYGASAAMTLPWLWGPGRAREEAAAARLRAEEHTLREVEDAIRAEVVEAHARVDGAARELALLTGDAQRAARQSVEAAETGYVTGGSTLLGWLDAARGLLDLRMEAIDLGLELDRALAALDEAVGEALPRVARDGGAP